jgi:hypothetical protein
VLVPAAIAAVVIAGVAIGVPLGFLTRGDHSTPASGTSPSSGSGGAATVQARALYDQALTAMRGSAGFHYVAESTGGGPAQTIAGDAGQSGGRQDITIGAAAGREQFTLILASGTVYFQGNAPALEDQLGVPGAGAPGLQGKWISVTNQDGPYIVVAPGITVADQVQETALTPTSTASILGGSATRIRGSVPAQAGAPGGTGYLDIVTRSHLPISYVSTLSISGVTATTATTFSRWGTAAAPAVPSGAVVAWSTLGASAPSGGYGSGGGSLSPSPTPQL